MVDTTARPPAIAARSARRGRALVRARVGVIVTAGLVLLSFNARAEDAPLPSPLEPAVVARLAQERRPEVAGARAKASAASERPMQVSALPDPMVAVTVDYLPIDLHGVNGNVTLQQEFPLSGVLGNRRRAAEADAERWNVDTRRVGLDVEFEALEAFFILGERRETTAILDEQIAITEELTVIARAHLASGQGMQADVLRLDNETARLRADRRALDADIRAAEAMLDTALARDLAAPIPPLAWTDDVSDPPALEVLARKALGDRPELASARAARRRALAEVDTMRSMYGPMLLLRAGPSYMTRDGPGVMAMVGLSLPIWRERLGAGVSEARSMVDMASADIAATERMVVGNVAVARERVLAQRIQLLAIREDILPRARQVVASATGSFAAGQGPMLAVLDASRDLREIRMQELAARGRLGDAWARLRRETGGAP